LGKTGKIEKQDLEARSGKLKMKELKFVGFEIVEKI